MTGVSSETALAGSSSWLRRRGELEFRPRTVVIASVMASLVLAALGCLGDICLGDECPHIRHARAYLQTGRRVPYDPIFASSNVRPVPFSGTPLWHAGLAGLWKLTGGESQCLAQAYQAGFYLLLLLSVYFGARRLWGPAEASWAWLLIATMPMVCVYSVVLYQDVPGVALSALAMLLLWRRNFLWCGVAMAAAYMTKMNVLTWAPWACLFALWWAGGPWQRRLSAAVRVAAPVAAVLAYDAVWRASVYDNWMGYAGRFVSGLSREARTARTATPTRYVWWKPYPITDVKSILSHLGPLLSVGTLVGLLRARDLKSGWLWGGLALALGGLLTILVPGGTRQMRYILPTALAMAFLAGKALAGLRPPGWLRVLVVAGCVLQAALAAGFVCHKRRISDPEMAAYAWIRDNTPEDARILFPEQLLTNQTGRVYVWEAANPAYILTEATDAERALLLGDLGVTHVAVPLRRLYDPQEEGAHAGGYPRDFVEKLPALPGFEKVFENSDFLIYRFVGPR